MTESDTNSSLPFIVIPCFNEEKRIDVVSYTQLAQSGRIKLVFVDDGSTDDTLKILTAIQKSSDSVIVETLGSNRGKGEAVRCGLNVAVERGAAIVGYFDADLATPVSELLRIVQTIEFNPELNGVLGSRISRLGAHIERDPLRHYVGRIYGTLAAIILGIPIYDTQCGAKVFRVSSVFVEAISTPFRSQWSFDVVLLHRLINRSATCRREEGSTSSRLPASSFLELPLNEWQDVPGSKVKLHSALSAFLQVVFLAFRSLFQLLRVKSRT